MTINCTHNDDHKFMHVILQKQIMISEISYVRVTRSMQEIVRMQLAFLVKSQAQAKE